MPGVVYADKPIAKKWDEIWSKTTIENQLNTINAWPDVDSIIMDVVHKLSEDPFLFEGGCGLGRYVIHLREHGYRVVGLEYSAEALLALHKSQPDLNLSIGDVKAIGIKDHVFDLYLSLGVFEHFEEGPLESLKEAQRILKPGGILLITGPYYLLNWAHRVKSWLAGQGYLRKIFRKPPLKKTKGDFFEYHYHPAEMKKLLECGGFAVNKISPIGMWIGIWGYFPIFRQKKTKKLTQTELAESGQVRTSFLSLAVPICRVFISLFPWAFAPAWCIVARSTLKFRKDS